MCDRSESPSGRDLKRQRLLSPSKDACVVFEICNDRIRGATPYEYHIYFLHCDPNSGNSGGDEFARTKPTLRLQWDYPLAFCGLDSTLYMFEGHDIRNRGKETGFAAKFQITPKILAKSPNYNLEKANRVRLKRMRHRKYYPAALPTPDGKSILVFSLRVEKKCCDPTFELYDIARDSYQPLPPLDPKIHTLDLESNSVDIMAYGFQTKCHFVVETVHREIYVLNLSRDIKKWKQYHRQLPKAGNSFIGIDAEFFFTDDCVCDVAFARRTFPLPRSVLPPHEKDDFIEYLSRTTLLDGLDNVGAYHTCAVQAEIYPDSTQYAFTCDSDREKYAKRHEDICLLVVDVCSTNIQKYKTEVKKYKRDKQGFYGDEGKRPVLSTIGIKTLKFIVNVDRISFITMALFSI